MDKHSDKQKPVEREAEQHREQRKEHADKVHVAGDDSFPASDPPSFTPVKGSNRDKQALKDVADGKDGPGRTDK